MKPRPRPAEPYSWTYKFLVPLILYLEDLRDAFRVLAQVGTVRAETDTHTDIETFEDLLTQEGRPLKELTMVATAADGETVTVHFSPREGTVKITSPRVEFTGALHQIQQIGWRHWRKFSLADTGIMFLLVMPAIFVGVIASAGLLSGSPWSIPLMIAVGVIGFLVIYLGGTEARTRWTLMPMVSYANRSPSFLKRNRDQIIISLILLVVGYLLGLWAPFPTQ